MKTMIRPLFAACLAFFSFCLVRAEVDSALQTKIDSQVAAAKQLAADPAVVAAVKGYNVAPSPEAQAMTQEKWKTLTLLDPLVRSFSKSPAGLALKAGKSEFVAEAFVSGADGGKVAFLAKTTSWNHHGKAKHDVPMQGKVWQGDIEVDESTGLQQIQIAVPVLDGDTPIGSLVVGLSITKLKN